ncbi:FecCD family ABC transporter permease [Thalassotalea maritima]|uniref:FecCD family ABC transporter permease n=1 Tax=Thalassotalea maritima TaxID=3242416 RepID=UPI003529D0F0
MTIKARNTTRFWRTQAFLVCLGVALLSLFFAMGTGVSGVSYQQLFECLNGCDTPLTQTILFDIRLPRVLTGFLAGFGLAMSGALMQNVTRNPLADPYLFGLVAGAGLGATLATLLPVSWQFLSIPVAAFLGALASITVVLVLLRQAHWHRVEHLLLAGVAVSFLCSAITSFILYMGDAFAANRVIFWLMGSLANHNKYAVVILVTVIVVSLLLSLALARQLDALLLSDESAQSLGVDVKRLRVIILLSCAAMCAVIVAFCGGIGFVGLMIPHIVRHFFAKTTAKLIIFSGLIGGSFLVWVDVLARTLLDGQEIPIGVITSLLGSVFFLILLRQMKSN